MSTSEAERFVDDVAKNKQLAERVKPHAAGLSALVAGAKTLGYTFTVDELKQAMRSKAKQNLNDAQLDAIAGGQQSESAVNAVNTIAAVNNAQAVQMAWVIAVIGTTTTVATLVV